MTKTWIDKKNYFAFLLVFWLVPVMSQAGGLGMAAIAAIGGAICLVGIKPGQFFKSIKGMPTALWFLMGLLIWGVISSFWSPYESPRTVPNPYILLLGVPLYLLFGFAMATRSSFKDVILSRIIILTTIGSALAILIDLVSGYSISLTIDPISAGENQHRRIGDVIQNLNHGVSVSTLFLPPVAMLLWKGQRLSKFTAVTLTVVILLCAVFAGVSASIIAVIATSLMMVFASKWPTQVLKLSFGLAIASLVLSPLLAYVMAQLSNEQLAALPFSWEERAHNWAYLHGKIWENPVLGHGFDAVRTFDESHTIRGFEGRALVSLHPHNAGLHIWVETGLIGIAFACLALFYAGKRLCSTGTLSSGQSIAASGLIVSAMANSVLTYGVWQDWWWASIIIATSVTFIISPAKVDLNLGVNTK